MSTLRVANEADIPNLLRLGYNFFSKAGLPKALVFDEEYLEEWFYKVIDSELCFILINNEGTAMCGAVVTENFFTGQLTGNELFWWVEPEARKTGAGKEMMVLMERWAKDIGAVTFSMCGLTTSNFTKVDKIYRASGYVPTEVAYTKEV